ncbi:hypothetical protein CYMTET_43495 [Cymbomonas tetramitiformis]|uniref:Chlorophyllase n=1 Tax=Cymbomonas tetramitiformis TaxID=36881 RepID=A0AAE0EZX4_9CHLO|nr:hypothetical protein CYMTET_43495 [Cymbomonas tetramitiformis]
MRLVSPSHYREGESLGSSLRAPGIFQRVSRQSSLAADVSASTDWLTNSPLAGDRRRRSIYAAGIRGSSLAASLTPQLGHRPRPRVGGSRILQCSLGRSTDDSEREHGTDEIRVNRRRFIGQVATASCAAGSAKSEETTPPFATPSSAEALFSASEPRAAAAAGVPNYLEGGAFRPGRASRQKHTCTDCYPLCITAGCQLRINVTYPRNFLDGDAQHQYPFPLAVFTSGFLVPSEQYQSYADHLASWGYVVLTYDKVEGINSTLDDIVSSCLLRELIDWAESNEAIAPLTDTSSVYLCGHSRGAKVSVLAAAEDPRVVAACLIDPVDNTVYAPLSPGFPSAVATLESSQDGRGLMAVDAAAEGTREADDGLPPSMRPRRASQVAIAAEPVSAISWVGNSIPVAVVGAEKGGDCAPKDANYQKFFDAAPAPSWMVTLKDAGHFQFVDSRSTVQRSVCAEGRVSDTKVNAVARGVLVAWAELHTRIPQQERSDCYAEVLATTVAHASDYVGDSEITTNDNLRYA